MKSCSRFLTIPALLFASILLVIVGAVISPCRAAIPNAESDAERYVLDQLQRGAEADLSRFLVQSRPVSAHHQVR